jgi:hypothetical protein
VSVYLSTRLDPPSERLHSCLTNDQLKVPFLYCRFLVEVGLVPVEQQMKEMGIHKTEATDEDKRN